MNETNRKLRYRISVALMAALCFLGTYIHIPIPMPIGNIMIHMGNTVCLMASVVLGGLGGGVAGGVGMALFDLSSPLYTIHAPFTLVQKFLAGFVCGKIAFLHGKNGDSFRYNLLGTIVGGLVNLVLAQVNSLLIDHFLLGSALDAVIATNLAKLPINALNMVLAVVASMLLAAPVKLALKRLNKG